MPDRDGDTQPILGRDPLTFVISGFLALVSVVGFLCCLGYAVWWLAVYWAP